MENMDTETRELQYSRVEMEEQVSSVAEKFEDRVKELGTAAAADAEKMKEMEEELARLVAENPRLQELLDYLDLNIVRLFWNVMLI